MDEKDLRPILAWIVFALLVVLINTLPSKPKHSNLTLADGYRLRAVEDRLWNLERSHTEQTKGPINA